MINRVCFLDIGWLSPGWTEIVEPYFEGGLDVSLRLYLRSMQRQHFG